jgi:hypothetical protein
MEVWRLVLGFVLAFACFALGYVISWLYYKKPKTSQMNPQQMTPQTPDKKEYKYSHWPGDTPIREDIKEAMEPKEVNRSFFEESTNKNILYHYKRHQRGVDAFEDQVFTSQQWKREYVLVRDLLASDLGLDSWKTHINLEPKGTCQKWVDVEISDHKQLYIFAISTSEDAAVQEIYFTHGRTSNVVTTRNFSLDMLYLTKDENRPYKLPHGFFYPAVMVRQPEGCGSRNLAIEFCTLTTSSWIEIQLYGKVIELTGRL